MRALGVYPMDVRARNYGAGLFLDMSIAITTPHSLFKIRPRRQVRVFQWEDLLMFDKVCTLLELPCSTDHPASMLYRNRRTNAESA